MSTYYTPPPSVVDGDVAYAQDVNSINNAADSAFDLVEGAVGSLVQTVSVYSDKAEEWAEKAENSEVEPGKYSALHHASKASASASSALGSASAASGYASAASISASSVAGAAISATASATLASKYATEAEDTEVEPGKYSAFHWSKKAEQFAIDVV
jgi:hypothetical protein